MSWAVFATAVRYGWRGLAIAAGSIAAMLWLAFVAYQQVDMSVYESLPEAMLSLMGIPRGADLQVLAYNEMLGAIGPLALVGVAIAWGTAAVAGEEANRSLSVVLATPTSRTGFVLAKALALLVLVVATSALLWGIAELLPITLGIETGQTHLFALCLHLSALIFFHGCLALAIGAASGRGGLAAGITALIAVLGWLGVGLLPLWEETADLVGWLPWGWFNANAPLLEGIDWLDVARLAGGAVLALVVAVVGFTRRDLGQNRSGLLDRLRGLPGVAKLMSDGGTGSGLFAVGFAANRNLLWAVSFIMFALMGVAMGPLYAAMSESLEKYATAFPPELLALVGGAAADLGTPAGFYQTEVMGMMAPIAVIVAGTAAAAALAGEERQRRLSLVLAQPVSRVRVVATTALIATCYVAVVCLATFLGLWGGVLLAGIELAAADIAAACLLLFGLGMLHLGITLLVAAATGSSQLAVWVTVGVAIAGHFGRGLAELSDSKLIQLSPFHYYGDQMPLAGGMRILDLVVLMVAAAVLIAAAFPAFAKRDLRLR